MGTHLLDGELLHSRLCYEMSAMFSAALGSEMTYRLQWPLVAFPRSVTHVRMILEEVT